MDLYPYTPNQADEELITKDSELGEAYISSIVLTHDLLCQYLEEPDYPHFSIQEIDQKMNQLIIQVNKLNSLYAANIVPLIQGNYSNARKIKQLIMEDPSANNQVNVQLARQFITTLIENYARIRNLRRKTKTSYEDKRSFYKLINNLNLRQEPSLESQSLGTFEADTVVEGIQTNSDGTWLQVQIPKPGGVFYEGWMLLKFLRPLTPMPLTWRLGINIREFAYYGSEAPSLKFTHETFRFQQLEVCKDIGIKLVRFFASHYWFNIYQSITFIRQALDTLSAFDMQAIICLEDSMGLGQQMPGNEAFHTGPYGHLNADYWRNKAYQQTYIPHIRQIVREFQDHPAVLVWELGNEFTLQPQPPRPGDDIAFLEFVKEASGEIKMIAPDRLVSLGLITTDNVFKQKGGNEQRYAWAKQLYSLASVDVIGVHYSHQDSARQKKFITIDIQAAKDLGKPFYVGELGTTANETDRPSYYAAEIIRWRQEGAFTVMPSQLDSSQTDMNISTTDFGFARWRDHDYDAILHTLKEFGKIKR